MNRRSGSLGAMLAVFGLSGCGVIERTIATPEQLFERAKVRAMSGEWQKAEQDCRAALRKQPEYYPAQLLLGDALGAQNRQEEAIAAYSEAARLQPSNPKPHLGLAAAWRGKHRSAEAIAEYRAGLLLGTANPADLHFQIGTLLQQQGDAAGALAEFDEALRLAPNDTSLAGRVRQQRDQSH